jgi:hypothetical protein
MYWVVVTLNLTKCHNQCIIKFIAIWILSCTIHGNMGFTKCMHPIITYNFNPYCNVTQMSLNEIMKREKILKFKANYN